MKKIYRDPAPNLRGPQSQTLGSAKALKGRMPSVPHMKRAAKRIGSANPSRWSSQGR